MAYKLAVGFYNNLIESVYANPPIIHHQEVPVSQDNSLNFAGGGYRRNSGSKDKKMSAE